MKNPIPVTVLTGFLGSGKTTLLNHLIKSMPDKKFAIIENEFGKIPIDNELVISAEEDLFTLENGCICCSLQSDITDILVRLAARKEKIDHVIIESTGVADPAPVAQLFINNMQLQHFFSLDGVICVVDAVNFELQKQQQPETIKQLVMADLIVINKTDKVTDEMVATLDDSIQLINRTAKRVRSTHTQVPIGELLSLRAYDLVKMESTLATATFFQPAAPLSLAPTRTPHQHHDQSAHDIQTFSMRFKGNLNFLKFNAWFNTLVTLKGNNLYRSKGVISSSTSDKKIIFQSVHHEIDGLEGKTWGEEVRENRLVFIGKGLAEGEIRKGVLACLV